MGTRAQDNLKFVGEDDEPFEAGHAFRKHSPWLMAFLRRRFGSQDAEDLVQETYLRTAGVKANVGNARAFLARIALNVARDQIRRRRARPVLVGSDSGPTPVEYGSQTEALLLKQTILALPPKLREVFVLNRFAGMAYQEIADHLGLSVKTVEKRMSKAIAFCAAMMR